MGFPNGDVIIALFPLMLLYRANERKMLELAKPVVV